MPFEYEGGEGGGGILVETFICMSLHVCACLPMTMTSPKACLIMLTIHDCKIIAFQFCGLMRNSGLVHSQMQMNTYAYSHLHSHSHPLIQLRAKLIETITQLSTARFFIMLICFWHSFEIHNF